MIRWVFLDVGNVLLDEDFLTFHVLRRHVEAIRRVRPDLSFLDLIAERRERARGGSRWPLFDLASAYLDEEAVAAAWNAVDAEVRRDFPLWNPPVVGIRAVLEGLSREYSLGLIANQPRECRRHLRGLGLLDFFSVVALSEEEGVRKPAAELFERAVTRAGVQARCCVMVGDRMDNDILPAASLGMATILVEWPCREAKGWDGGGPEGSAYLVSLQGVSGSYGEKATLAVATTAHLPAALELLRDSRGHANRL